MTMTLPNFETQSQSPRKPRRLPRPQTPDAQTLPLRSHPKWTAYLHLLGHKILAPHPELRPLFLELLDEADLL
jgi:hypothetical protein